jgi:predicted PurR-regulated permease PerM
LDTQKSSSSSTLNPRDWVARGFYVALGVALLYVLATVVHEFGMAVLAVATPFVVGIGIAVLIDPLIRRVERYQMRRSFAVLVVFGAFLMIVVGTAYATIPALINQAGDFATEGPTSVAKLKTSVDKYLAKHQKLGPIKLPKNSDTLLSKISDTASEGIQKSAGNIAEVLIGSASVIVQAVVSIIITFYVLMDYDRLRSRFFFLVPAQYRGYVRSLSGDVGGVFAQYVRGLVLECTIFGICIVIMLEALAFVHPKLMDSALLVGALAGILYAVPYLGALVITLLCFLVSFAAGGFWFGIGAAVASFVINQAFDYIVTPKVIGAGVGLHPIAALFALAMGGEMFHNVWGLILSVPVAGSIQVIFYRLFPKLCEPTPKSILEMEGVEDDDPDIPRIPTGGAVKPAD